MPTQVDYTSIDLPPITVSSPSHPDELSWNPKRDAFLTWTFPVPDQKTKGIYYVLDHYGDTMPTARAKFVPATQKQLLKTGLRPGIWVFHFVWADTQGRLSRKVVHYQLRIGTDPGTEIIQGTVYDDANQPLSSATLTINRGLFPNQTTDSMGKFAWGKIPIGAWSITAINAGHKSVTRKVALQPGAPATIIFALAKRTR